jgi:hypothetical protein
MLFKNNKIQRFAGFVRGFKAYCFAVRPQSGGKR